MVFRGRKCVKPAASSLPLFVNCRIVVFHQAIAYTPYDGADEQAQNIPKNFRLWKKVFLSEHPGTELAGYPKKKGGVYS
jgi:hypothetical protein